MITLPNNTNDNSFEKNESEDNHLSSISLSDIRKTQKNLIDTIFMGDAIDYSSYLDLFESPPKKQPKSFPLSRIPNPDLDEMLDELSYLCDQRNDYVEAIKIADDILKHYSKIISRGEYIRIMLDKAFAYHQLHDVLSTYKQLLLIEPYRKYFDHDQAIGFHDFKGNVLLYIGERTNNMKLFQKALDHYHTILDLSDDIHPLLPDVYQRTIFKIAKIYVYMNKDDEAMEIFKEIILMPDDIFTGDEIAEKTNKQLKSKSREWLRYLSEKKGE